jgi:hypothetical protein
MEQQVRMYQKTLGYCLSPGFYVVLLFVIGFMGCIAVLSDLH